MLASPVPNAPGKGKAPDFHDFVPNEDTDNIRADLLMLKLKGYMDRKNLTGKNQELRSLPAKVQVGRMI